MSNGKDFGNVIYSYTRAQAIADGVLIDVTDEAKAHGFKVPVAITDHLFHGYVAFVSATAPMDPLGAQLMEPRSAPIMEPFGDQAMEPFRDHLMEPGQR